MNIFDNYDTFINYKSNFSNDYLIKYQECISQVDNILNSFYAEEHIILINIESEFINIEKIDDNANLLYNFFYSIIKCETYEYTNKIDTHILVTVINRINENIHDKEKVIYHMLIYLRQYKPWYCIECMNILNLIKNGYDINNLL